MTQRQLTIAVNKILREEARYATGLEKGGDFGRAKLAHAAIEEIKRAVRMAAGADDDSYAGALRAALIERRAEYRQDWNDEDGVGTSTFSRVLDLVDEDGA
ncbi:hypothetical protein [Magnetospirillum moscoviense]|nr:hypothetical protein [Magnetospirillum moscoviense]MBF0324481.1 hypothetical protein [Alphaproteobacteria bacterium]